MGSQQKDMLLQPSKHTGIVLLIRSGRYFNGEVGEENKLATLVEKQVQKNIIVEVGKVSEMQRLLNTVHMMAKHNIPIAVFEPLIRLQTANGAEMGTRYFSRESFK